MSVGDTVSERSSKTSGERCGGEEEADTQAELVAEVEEGEVVWDTWAEACFKRAEEEAEGLACRNLVDSFTRSDVEATYHHSRPTLHPSLRTRYDSPAEYGESGPNMRWECLPEKSEWFENDVSDVKDGEEPLIIPGREVKVSLHASRLCVPAIQNLAQVFEVAGEENGDGPNIRAVEIA